MSNQNGNIKNRWKHFYSWLSPSPHVTIHLHITSLLYYDLHMYQVRLDRLRNTTFFIAASFRLTFPLYLCRLDKFEWC